MPMTRHYPGSGYSASDWIKQIFDQSEAQPTSLQRRFISMEFLRLNYISRGYQWWYREMSAVFPSYCIQTTGCQTHKRCVARQKKTCSWFQARESIQPWFGVEYTGKCTFLGTSE